MRRSPAVLAPLIVLAILAAACSTAAPPSSPGPSAPTDPVLPGTAWRLTILDGVDVPRDAGMTLAFGADQASGSGGCNTFGGPYTVDGLDLRFGDIASTLIGCEPPVGDREVAFHAALADTVSWTVVEGQLVLVDADGDQRLAFAPALP
jgi:heat shock protein HslJ